MPFPRSLKDVTKQKPSMILVQTLPAQGCRSDFLPQWHFLESQLLNAYMVLSDLSFYCPPVVTAVPSFNHKLL